MYTVLICLAAALLAAGVSIIRRPSKAGGSNTADRGGESPVTMRSAGASCPAVRFDPTGMPGGEQPADLLPDAESFAEEEPTLIEEFADPATTPERRREIARTFDGLNCRFTLRDDPDGDSGSPDDGQTSWESEGCDEVMTPPEPDEYL